MRAGIVVECLGPGKLFLQAGASTAMKKKNWLNQFPENMIGVVELSSELVVMAAY